jgi:ABC-type spermidine/putrescine transport system permease subunit II
VTDAEGVQHRPTRLFLWIVSSIVLLYLVLPVIVIVPLSFNATDYLRFPPAQPTVRWYAKYFSDPSWRAATRNSLMIATIATILSTSIGSLAALALARRTFGGKSLLQQFFVVPMTIPEILTAVSLYYFYALLSVTGLRLLNSLVGVAIGHSVLAIPMVFLMVSASLSTVDPSVEHASLTLGAGPLRTFWHVTLPLIRPGVLGSAFLAFLTSLNDILIALFVSGVETNTLTKKMWEAIRFELDPTIAAVSSTFIVATVLVLGTTALLRARR